MSEARITLGAQDKTGGAFASVGRKLDGLGAAAEGLASRLAGVTAGLGVALVAKGYLDGIAEGVDKLNDLKDATGASVANISALEDVAKRTGANFETVAASLTKLNRGLQSAKQGDDFSGVIVGIGLEVEKLKSMDPAAALLDVAKGLDQYANDGNKARATQVLFGKSLEEVAPFLKDLAEAGQLNATVTDEQAAAAERYANRLAANRKNFEDMGRAVLGELLPAIEAVQQSFDRAGDSADRFSGVATVLRTAVEAVTILGANVAHTFEQVGRNIGAAVAQAGALARLDLAGFRAISDAAEADGKRALKSLEAFEKRVLRIGNTGGDGAGAGRGFVNPPGVTAPSLNIPNAKARVKDQVREFDKYIDRLVESLRATQNLSAAEQVRVDLALDRLGKVSDAESDFAIELAKVVDLSKRQAEFVGPDLGADLLEQRKRDADAIRRLIDASADTQFDAAVAKAQLLIETMRQGDITTENYRRAMESLGKEFEALEPKFEKLSTFADQAARNIQDALGDSLLASMEGKFDSISKIWGAMLKRMVAQAAAADLARSIFGDDFAKTGQIGGWGRKAFDFLGGLFDGARAEGGPIQPGRAYLVGERGPEIVVPRAAGTVVPNGAALQAGPTYQVVVQGDASANTVRLINNALAQFEARRMRAD